MEKKMKKRAQKQCILGVIVLVLFILFTLSLKVVNMQPIGPNGSYVAYAGINKMIHELFGVNMTLYNITDWAGVAAIFIAIVYHNACNVCDAHSYDAVSVPDKKL